MASWTAANSASARTHVRRLLRKLQRRPPGGDRQLEAAGPAEPGDVAHERVDERGDRDRRDREVVPAQAERRKAGDQREQRGGEHAGRKRQPRREAVRDAQRRRVRAAREEDRVPERDVPAVAADPVPRLAEHRVQQQREQQIEQHGVVQAERREQTGDDDRAERDQVRSHRRPSRPCGRSSTIAKYATYTGTILSSGAR